MFRYQAYGLCLEANRPIGGLLPASASAPVDLHTPAAFHAGVCFSPITSQLLHTGPERDSDGEPLSTLWQLKTPAQPATINCALAKAARPWSSPLDAAGTRLWATWKETVDFDDLIALLLRPGLAAVLWRRGITCLHASVVAIDGRAVAIVGEATPGNQPRRRLSRLAGMRCWPTT